MKKWTVRIFLWILAFSLVACTKDVPPHTPDEDPSQTQRIEETPVPGKGTASPEDLTPAEGDKTEKPDTTLKGDSYWVLAESSGDMRQNPPMGDNLLTDLTLWADGTARIREIENGIRLVSSTEEQSMTWTQEKDGTLHLYARCSEAEPYWSGVVTEDGIELHRFGGIFRFRQESMPLEGSLYSPAELQGVWLQTSSEVEGDVSQSMPGWFNSLVFCADQSGEEPVLRVSSEQHDYSGYANDSYYDKDITVLNEPLYHNCGNEVWCARIGAESPRNANGYPTETEVFVTLLDQNTLLQQHFFTIDGGPGVSYQTYKRILPKVSPELDETVLAGSNFELVGFTFDDGTRQAAPPGISDFQLHFDTQGTHFFTVTYDDGREQSGSGHWTLGEGSTLLLQNYEKDLDWPLDNQIDSEWFAGAAQNFNQIPEVYLWFDGGVMTLAHPEVSSAGQEGAADTMTDLEGNAFAAPANAALVYYGDEYMEQSGQDISWYRQNESVPLYVISDEPASRHILISCVNDNTPVWIETDGIAVARLGTMMAGESVIVRLDYAESGTSNLCFEFDDAEFFIGLTPAVLPLDTWSYITVN